MRLVEQLPPLHRYVRHLLLKELTVDSLDFVVGKVRWFVDTSDKQCGGRLGVIERLWVVLFQIRRLPWQTDETISDVVRRALLTIVRNKYEGIQLAASFLAGKALEFRCGTASIDPFCSSLKVSGRLCCACCGSCG